MKIVKTAGNKKTIRMSRKEWANIGKQAKWITAQDYDDNYGGFGDDDDLAEFGRQDSWEHEQGEKNAELFESGICPECLEELDENSHCINVECEEFFDGLDLDDEIGNDETNDKEELPYGF